MKTIKEFDKVFNDELYWEFLGKNKNNFGAVNINQNHESGIIERITNAIDAVIEREYMEHLNGMDFKNPEECASQLMQYIDAESVIIEVERGSKPGKWNITVKDKGTGISEEDLENTILKVQGGHKVSKPYLIGSFGQGGSTSFVFASRTIIYTKHKDSTSGCVIGVKKTNNPSIIYCKADEKKFLKVDKWEFGEYNTVIKMIDYDISGIGHVIQPTGSFLHMLNERLPNLPFECRLYDLDKSSNNFRPLRGIWKSLDRTSKVECQNNIHIPVECTYHDESTGYVDTQIVNVKFWYFENRDDVKTFSNLKTPVFLVVNSQNQGRYGIGFMEHCNLTYLSRNSIVGIDFSNFKENTLKMMFVSTREKLGDSSAVKNIMNTITAKISGWQELRELNEAVKSKRLQGNETFELDKDVTKRISDYVSNFISGKMLPGTNSAINKETAIMQGNDKTIDDDVDVNGGAKKNTLPKVQYIENPTYFNFSRNLYSFPDNKRPMNFTFVSNGDPNIIDYNEEISVMVNDKIVENVIVSFCENGTGKGWITISDNNLDASSEHVISAKMRNFLTQSSFNFLSGKEKYERNSGNNINIKVTKLSKLKDRQSWDEVFGSKEIETPIEINGLNDPTNSIDVYINLEYIDVLTLKTLCDKAAKSVRIDYASAEDFYVRTLITSGIMFRKNEDKYKDTDNYESRTIDVDRLIARNALLNYQDLMIPKKDEI